MNKSNVEFFTSKYVECQGCGAIDLNCQGTCEKWCSVHAYSYPKTAIFYWNNNLVAILDLDKYCPFDNIDTAVHSAKAQKLISEQLL